MSLITAEKVGTLKKVLWIPHWIQEVLARQNLPLSAVLDYNQARKYLSVDEQALICHMQEYSFFDNQYDKDGMPSTDYVIGQANGVTQFWPKAWLRDVWGQSVAANDKEAKSEIEAATYWSLNDLQREVAIARLFSKHDVQKGHEKPFITYDIASDVLAVVMYPGYFNQEVFRSFKMDLLKSVLKVLYVYNTYAEVSKSPYYQKYLGELANTSS